jgi:uncharacterized protein YbjT (DUF2867 family)
MPVLVTGAEDGLGARVVERLRASGGEVRAWLDATVAGDARAAQLRAQGCKVALGEPDDEGHLEAALAQVHTVAHCWGGPLRDVDAQLDAAATLASALLGAGVRRLVWVRELAVGPTNPYLAVQDEIARLVDALPIETVTLATALRYGADDPLTRRLIAGWLSGTGVDPDAPHAPVALDDVAHAIEVADRQRGGTGELHIRLGLVGPQAMTLRRYLARIGAPDPATGPEVDRSVPGWVADWLSRPAARAADGDGTITTVARGAVALPAG